MGIEMLQNVPSDADKLGLLLKVKKKGKAGSDGHTRAP
jgi:hypothetical protein